MNCTYTCVLLYTYVLESTSVQPAYWCILPYVTVVCRERMRTKVLLLGIVHKYGPVEGSAVKSHPQHTHRLYTKLLSYSSINKFLCTHVV